MNSYAKQTIAIEADALRIARLTRTINAANGCGSDLSSALRIIAGEIRDDLAETKERLTKLIACAHGNGLSGLEAADAYKDLDGYLDDLSAELIFPIEREIEARGEEWRDPDSERGGHDWRNDQRMWDADYVSADPKERAIKYGEYE